jgi:general secretion pathway protein D
MKKLLIALSLFSTSAFSAPVELRFDSVDLTKFINATYGSMLHKNYVQSPDLLAQPKKVSLNVTIEDTELNSFLSGFLSQMGVYTSEKNGVVYFSNSPPKVQSRSNNLASVPDLSVGLLPPPMMPNGSVSNPQFDPMPVIEPPVNFVYHSTNRTPAYICEIVKALFLGTCTPTSNNAILSTTKEQKKQFLILIKDIDATLNRVQVNAVFVEVSDTDKDSFSLSATANLFGGQIGVNVGDSVSNGAISIKGANFGLVLDAIKTQSKFKQIASPSGFVNSGESFLISIGDEVPTIGSTNKDNSGTTSESVVYRPSGVILDVKPNVIPSKNPKIELIVKGQVSSFSATATGVNNSPTLTKREINTNLTLEDGEIVIIGGLKGVRSNDSKNRLFGVIPWGYNQSNSNTELILILTAKVQK